MDIRVESNSVQLARWERGTWLMVGMGVESVSSKVGRGEGSLEGGVKVGRGGSFGPRPQRQRWLRGTRWRHGVQTHR